MGGRQLRRLSMCGAIGVLAAALAATLAAQPAVSPAAPWTDREQTIEAHLRTAQVTSIEDIGTGVTHPRRAHLTPSSPVESFAWKVLPPGRRNGYWESYKSEIAAYELDRLLGMRMVPPAVERDVHGETGAAIMWVDGMRSVKQMGGKMPTGAVWGKSVRKMLMFDVLIANKDRNAGNILIGPPGSLILIDHSRAFIADTSLPPIERVDAELWDRVKALTREDLTRTLKPWLDAQAIDAIVERRDGMVRAVDRLVARKGAALVIIP